MYLTLHCKMDKLAGFAIMVLTMLSIYSCTSKQPEPAGPKQVLLANVESASSTHITTYPGRTQAAETANVAFRVSGTLASLSVHEGDHVRRGQVIARMDDRDYRTQLQATEAEYAQVKAEAERVMNLYRDSVMAASTYDKARYGLQQMEQKLRNHRDQLADCVLYAPFDGYVRSVLHEAHETIGAGMPILRLYAEGNTEITIFIPASEFQHRDAFESFTAQFDVLPGEVFPLQLVSISHQANVNQLYEVRLSFKAPNSQITPGMSTTVALHYQQQDNATTIIPASAILHDEKGTAVMVYKDGKVKRTSVEVSVLHRNGTAEITTGLIAGQQIVTSGVHTLSDGETVKPYPTPSKTNVGGLL